MRCNYEIVRIQLLAVSGGNIGTCRQTRLDLFDGPGCVFRDQRFRVGGRSFQGRQVVAVPDISQGHTNIPEESASLDSLDRRTAKKLAELRVVQGKAFAQGHPNRRARREGSFPRGRRETVPRTRVKAIVATINAIADERPQFERDRAFQLDRQVRDATARIEPMRFRDRAGRARGDAALTTSASRLLWRVGGQLERGQNFAEKNQVPSFGSISIVLLPCQPMPASAA